MNLTIGRTSSQTARLVRTHTLAIVGGACLSIAAISGGAFAVFHSGGEAAPAPRARISTFQSVVTDWKTTYYVVPTVEAGKVITDADYELQNTIMLNGGELPRHTTKVFVVDTPEQEDLLAKMEAEVSPETTEFVDLRYPPIPAFSMDGNDVPASVVPAAGDVTPADTNQAPSLYQPYPCSEPDLGEATMLQLAGLCQ